MINLPKTFQPFYYDKYFFYLYKLIFTYKKPHFYVALKGDKTCMYLTNSNQCEWSLSEDVISIIISKEVNEDCNIKVYMEDGIITEESATLNFKLNGIEEIKLIYINEPWNILMLETKDCSQIDKVYNEIVAFENIKHLDKHNDGTKTEHT